MSATLPKSAGDLSNLFAHASPPRRPGEPEPEPPGEDPPAVYATVRPAEEDRGAAEPRPARANSSARSSPATSRTRRPAAPPQVSSPARLDHMTRHQIDVAARRVVAARKRVDERLADLGTAVQAAADRRVDPAEIATVVAGAGLLPAEWPDDLAAQLGDGP